MTFRRLAALATVCLAITAANAPAAVIVAIQETGGGVFTATTGSLNTTGLSPFTSVQAGAAINPLLGFFLSQNPAAVDTPLDAYLGALTGPTSFGPRGLTAASSGDGNLFVLGASQNLVGTYAGYASGSPLSGSMAFAGATFASLGLTPGTYSYTFNSGANADTITVRVGPTLGEFAAVPEPVSLATLGALTLGGLGYARRRKVLS